MATGANSRSDATVKISIKTASPGDCISDKMANELVRRLIGTLPVTSNTGDSVVSRTPPEDKTKIWYLADENGIPTGEQFAYNPKTGAWESTSQSIPPIPCRSANSENIITLDASGCWVVTKNTIVELAETVSLSVSNDLGNVITLGSDGGLFYRGICVSTDTPNYISFDVDGCIRVIASTDTGNAIRTGTDDKLLVNLPKVLAAPITLLSGVHASGSINISTFTTIPSWATHAIIRQPSGQVFVPIASNFITHAAILSGESIILDGFITAQP